MEAVCICTSSWGWLAEADKRAGAGPKLEPSRRRCQPTRRTSYTQPPIAMMCIKILAATFMSFAGAKVKTSELASRSVVAQGYMSSSRPVGYS